MKVFLVYLHEDCFGPEWDYLQGVFFTRYFANKYVKRNEHKLVELKESRRAEWSYKIEIETVQPS